MSDENVRKGRRAFAREGGERLDRSQARELFVQEREEIEAVSETHLCVAASSSMDVRDTTRSAAF
jgi:hypothetical protein